MLFHIIMDFSYHQGILGWAEFWSLIIMHQKSAHNYHSRKLEYLNPQKCYIASQGGKWKILTIHIFLDNTFIKIGLGKGIDGVDIGGKSKFQCAKTQTKSLSCCNFFLWFLQNCWTYIIPHYSFNLICLEAKVKKN